MTEVLLDIAKDIESIITFESLAVANDTNQFMQFARVKPVVRAMVRNVRRVWNGPNFLASRIQFLLSEEYDPKYSRRTDTAIAIYLLVLDEVGAENAWGVAQDILITPGFRWARGVAEKICRKDLKLFIDEKPKHLVSVSIGKFVVTFDFLWYDIWVGVYVDRKNKKVYVCPLPMCVFCVSF